MKASSKADKNQIKTKLKYKNYIYFQACTICGALGQFIECKARKYIAFKSNTKAHVFHVGEHTCASKMAICRPSGIVRRSLQHEPRTSPSSIQGNAILGLIRSRKE